MSKENEKKNPVFFLLLLFIMFEYRGKMVISGSEEAGIKMALTGSIGG